MTPLERKLQEESFRITKRESSNFLNELEEAIGIPPDHCNDVERGELDCLAGFFGIKRDNNTYSKEFKKPVTKSIFDWNVVWLAERETDEALRARVRKAYFERKPAQTIKIRQATRPASASSTTHPIFTSTPTGWTSIPMWGRITLKLVKIQYNGLQLALCDDKNNTYGEPFVMPWRKHWFITKFTKDQLLFWKHVFRSRFLGVLLSIRYANPEELLVWTTRAGLGEITQLNGMTINDFTENLKR